MAFRLRNLKLKRISLVDSPANQAAVVTLFKRAEEKMEDEVMCGNKHKNTAKAMYCAECGDKMKKEDTEKADGILARLERLLGLAEKKQTETPAPAPAKEVTVEEALKSVPAPILAIIEKATKAAEDATKRAEDAEAKAKLAAEQADKLADEGITKRYVDEAKEICKNLSAKPEELGLILKRVDQGKTTKEDATELKRILKAASESCKTTLRIVGKSGDGKSGNAGDQLTEMVEAQVAKSDNKMSRAEAWDKVAKDNPELWKRHRDSMIGQPVDDEDAAVGEE